MTWTIQHDGTGSLGQANAMIPGSLELTLFLVVGRLVGFAQPARTGALYSLLHRVTIYTCCYTSRPCPRRIFALCIFPASPRTIGKEDAGTKVTSDPTWNCNDAYSHNLCAFCTGHRIRRSLSVGLTRAHSVCARNRHLEPSTDCCSASTRL
jgi:hypothetical protein